MTDTLSRIALLLGVETGELEALAQVPDDDLRTLHAQIANRLAADRRHRFARVAGLAQTIPGPIAGKLAEKFLSPAGAALVAEVLEPAKARDLVGRISVGYLASLAIVLDPIRAQHVVRAVPADRVGEVAQELFHRKEYAAMAGFVGAVEVDGLFASLGVASPHDLLAVVPLLTWNADLDRVIAELPEAQIDQIVTDLDVGELADLALAVEPHRFGPIVQAVPVHTVADIAGVLLERDEHSAMLRFAGVITPEMVSAALKQATEPQLYGLIAEVGAGHMWAELDQLVDGIDDESRDRLVIAFRDVPAESLDPLRAARRDGLLGRCSTDLLDAAIDSRP